MIYRITGFVPGIVSIDQQPKERPECPYCGNTHIIKYGHRKGKQRFLCYGCQQTFMHSTNTLMANSHYSQSIWADFIRDTLYGESPDSSAENTGFPIRLLSICGIRYLWPCKTGSKTVLSFFQELLNSMNLLYLTAIKAEPYQRQPDVKPVNMVQKLQNVASQMNMLQSVPESSVTEGSLQQL